MALAATSARVARSMRRPTTARSFLIAPATSRGLKASCRRERASQTVLHLALGLLRVVETSQGRRSAVLAPR